MVYGPNGLTGHMEDSRLPSEELMPQIAAGDVGAFELLVNRHEKDVLNLVYRFLGDREQANDLAQEVFLRVWQAARGYKPTAKFTTWLYKITANLCLNQLKSARRRRWFSFHLFDEESQSSVAETFPDDAPNAEDLVLTGERNREITETLQSLPANQRLALVLKIYEDLSYQEIAGILGCSVASVESLLVRGKRTLQKKLLPFNK
jgi:RNA polymerase sigma-70 factor (ECF subfamily)